MGGCYSHESGSAVTSPKHKLPAEKQPWCNEKGLVQYSSLTNGDSQFKEDQLLKQTKLIISVSAADTALPSVDSQILPEETEKVKGVVPSDSGIESIGPPVEESNYEVTEKNKGTSLCGSCHSKLKRISRGSCDQCGQFRVDTSELSLLLIGETYCTCGPREAGKQFSCQTHGTRSKFSSPSKRHSDIPVKLLKSNLKKQGQERGDSKHVRMSWKSADSLDLNSSMITCMDRAKSEASDVFGDDISFRAPLAQFDSVDNQLDVEHVDEEGGDVFFTSRMSIYSEILELADSICLCDFPDTPSEGRLTHSLSASEGQSSPFSKTKQPFSSQSTPTRLPVHGELFSSWPEEDEDSGRGLSKSAGPLESSLECSLEGVEEMDDHSLTFHSSPLGCAAVNMLENLSNECEEALCPVSVVVRGQQVIMMDAKTYSQLLNDVHLLKQQLLRLSQILQEEGGRRS